MFWKATVILDLRSLQPKHMSEFANTRNDKSTFFFFSVNSIFAFYLNQTCMVIFSCFVIFRVLVLNVLSRETLGRDKRLGDVHIPLKNFDPSETWREWFNLADLVSLIIHFFQLLIVVMTYLPVQFHW